MEIKIKPKIHKINGESRKLKIRKMFGDDCEINDSFLTKVFVFTFIHQPISVTEIVDHLANNYHEHYERTKVSRALNKLVNFGLIHKTTPSQITFNLDANERKPIHEHILAKHRKSKSTVPKQFESDFGNNMGFFWVANGDGIKYLPYCSKLLKFECNVEDKPNEIKETPRGIKE